MKKNCLFQEPHKGSALILTLLVITTLTGLTIAFSQESSIELDLATFSRDGFRAYQVARSGVHLALAELHKDEDKDMDGLGEDWGQFGADSFPDQFPEWVSVSSKITDENGKFNINSLIDKEGKVDTKREEQLLRLFGAMGVEEEMVPPLLDWLDSDDIERLDGAENYYYQSLEEPYACANSQFLTMGQIFLVKGMREISRFGDEGEKRLLDFLTIYSDGKVNINTASHEVLQSLSAKIDSSTAEAIIEYRKEEDFLRADDLKKVDGMGEEIYSGISKWVTVKSSVFSIESKGVYQEAAAQIKAVARRDAEKVSLIYWQVM